METSTADEQAIWDVEALAEKEQSQDVRRVMREFHVDAGTAVRMLLAAQRCDYLVPVLEEDEYEQPWVTRPLETPVGEGFVYAPYIPLLNTPMYTDEKGDRIPLGVSDVD